MVEERRGDRRGADRPRRRESAEERRGQQRKSGLVPGLHDDRETPGRVEDAGAEPRGAQQHVEAGGRRVGALDLDVVDPTDPVDLGETVPDGPHQHDRL